MFQKFPTVYPISIIFRVVSAIFALIFILILALPIGFYGMAMYIEPSLPNTSELRTMPLEMPLQIYTADNKLIGQYGNVYSLPITYNEIPNTLIQAFLAAEDDSFFEHSGISVKGLGRAITQMATDNGQQTGGSTITQQVAKNYFLTSEQTFERKLTEMFLARRIEKELSKNEIMTLYVNKIYLGQGAYGIKAGAKRYYNKELDELTISEIAMLAGLPKAPSEFNPVVNPKRALERRNWILGRMLTQRYITQDDYDAAINADINLNIYQEKLDYNMPYIAEMARTALVDKYGEHVMNSGWRVQLTIDSQNQLTAEQALVNGLKEYDNRHGWRGVEADEGDVTKLVSYHNMHPAQVTKVTQDGFEAVLNTGQTINVPWSQMRWARRHYNVNHVGGGYGSPSQMVKVGNIVRVSPTKDDDIWRLVQIPDVQGALVSIEPNTGAIHALVGGFNFYHNKFNRATQGYRQPGSIIKPLIYAAGIENKKYTPDSILEDSPLKIGNWQPKNADGSFRGGMSMRQALAVSRNIPVIRVYLGTGTAQVHSLLSNFGLERDRLPEGAALALGAADATPLQMATAYASFANGGHRIQPYFIDRIYDFHNNLIYQATIEHACALCFNSNLDKTNEQLLYAFENDSTNNSDQTQPEDDTIDTDLKATEPSEQLKPNQEDTKTPSVLAKTTYRLHPKNAPQLSVAQQAPRILSAQTAYDMAEMLKAVVTSGTGRRALAIGRPDIGGKTGTTNEAKDAWFAGIHPSASTVVWIGFDDPKTLGAREYGGVAALPVWVDYMKAYLKDKPKQWVDAKNHSKAETQTQKIVNLTDETPVEELAMTDIENTSFDIDGEIPEGDDR